MNPWRVAKTYIAQRLPNNAGGASARRANAAVSPAEISVPRALTPWQVARAYLEPQTAESKNAPVESYDALSIAFHWITALLVTAVFVLALVPGLVKGSVALHITLGLLLFLIVPLRVTWRLFKGKPQRRPKTSALERIAETTVQAAFYLLLIAVPVLGLIYLDAKGIDYNFFGLQLPQVAYYDRHLAEEVFFWKKTLGYVFLALIFVHAAAAVLYHHMFRRDGVLISMLKASPATSAASGEQPALPALDGWFTPRAPAFRFRGFLASKARHRPQEIRIASAPPEPIKRGGKAASLVVLLALALVGCSQPIDIDAYAAALVQRLSQACPMAAPNDVAAHESCRRTIGQMGGPINQETVLWGGDQSGIPFKEKNLTSFRTDLFQDLYVSLYMFTGKYTIADGLDGTKMIAVQAYFRNALPSGRYPYPFWHSADKWSAYETSNEVRFYVARDGAVRYIGRSSGGSEQARGTYAHVQPPAFADKWMWTDEDGALQPAVTLFSDRYSPDNPHVAALDPAYRKMALSLRDGDCTGCHVPDNPKKLHRLTLLQTPWHAATQIAAVLKEVRANEMPLDEHMDSKPLDAKTKKEFLSNGEAFKALLDVADEWERANGRGKQASTQPQQAPATH